MVLGYVLEEADKKTGVVSYRTSRVCAGDCIFAALKAINIKLAKLY